MNNRGSTGWISTHARIRFFAKAAYQPLKIGIRARNGARWWFAHHKSAATHPPIPAGFEIDTPGGLNGEDQDQENGFSTSALGTGFGLVALIAVAERFLPSRFRPQPLPGASATK